jgi:hypothetical protein
MWFPMLSYAMGIIPGPLAPWRNLYIFSGMLTITWGIIVFFIMPDSPLDAKFFNDRERYIAIERVRKNNAGITILNGLKSKKPFSIHKCIFLC